MARDEIQVFNSASSCRGRPKRISPRVYAGAPFSPMTIRLSDNRKCYVTTWMGEIPNLLLVAEPSYHNGPRTLKSVICQHSLTEEDALQINRAVAKSSGEELYAIMPDLFYGEQFGFALTARSVIGSDRGLRCGNLLYCTNNRSLTQVKELVLAITDDDLPVGYYAVRDKELNKRFTNAAYRYVDKSVCVITDLFHY